jgi:hypothetical protein
MRAATGRVSPAPGAPHVEQVGWGVARQVARELASRVDGPVPALLEDVVRLAEAPGHLVYVVFEGRTATAVALVALPHPREDRSGTGAASYVGDVVVGTTPGRLREALVVRALHDVANAGVRWLEVDDPEGSLRPLGFS